MTAITKAIARTTITETMNSNTTIAEANTITTTTEAIIRYDFTETY